MFFRKDVFNSKPSELETELSPEEIKENIFSADKRPIYIVGNNALTCYMAAKLTDAGHNDIIISDKENNISLSTNGISLKEDSSLKLSRYKLNTSFWIKEEPKLILLTADAGQLNPFLAALSKEKVGTAPVLCFTPLKDK